jgi:hypothetical protein
MAASVASSAALVPFFAVPKAATFARSSLSTAGQGERGGETQLTSLNLLTGHASIKEDYLERMFIG